MPLLQINKVTWKRYIKRFFACRQPHTGWSWDMEKCIKTFAVCLVLTSAVALKLRKFLYLCSVRRNIRYFSTDVQTYCSPNNFSSNEYWKGRQWLSPKRRHPSTRIHDGVYTLHSSPPLPPYPLVLGFRAPRGYLNSWIITNPIHCAFFNIHTYLRYSLI